jgi:hypothetical protein
MGHHGYIACKPVRQLWKVDALASNDSLFLILLQFTELIIFRSKQPQLEERDYRF